MANAEIITKRVAISKANAQMVAIVGVAAFVTIFCLVASKSALSENSYQARVISAQDKSKNQLASDLSAYTDLSKNYNNFVSSNTNILGGQSNSSGNNGGTNTKVVLDALPPSYDFPSLASAVGAILSGQGLSVGGIGGTDNELTQQSNTTSANPTPVAMPFSFSVNNLNYQQIGTLFNTLQHSVRPIVVDSISVNGGGNNITLSVQAHTYYQPGINFTVGQQEVK